MAKLTILVPAYNEEGCIFPFYEAVEPFLKKLSYETRYLFIDDGSKDKTLEEIKALREKDPRVNFISFSRNCGKEAAMDAGLKASINEDAVIMMDADLQHPPYLIPEMVKKMEEGYKIVYTRQKTRKGDSPFKKACAHAFYNVFNRYSDVRIEQSSKDYMLMVKDVVKAFISMPDEYRFTKGIFSFVGFKRYCLEFDFVKREVGKTKWNFGKLLKYGISGLSQFSHVFLAVPLFVSIFSFLVAVLGCFFYGFHLIGLESYLIMLVGGILFSLTNLSLYWILYVLYSTRRETMKRPLYFIEESSFDGNENR